MTSGAGRVALVTGAGMGIGNGIARALAADGFRVAAHYGRSADGAERLVADVTAAGGEAIAVQGDLRRVADCDRIVAAAVERFRRSGRAGQQTPG